MLTKIFSSEKGEPLSKWLRDHKEEIKSKRILYVLRANMDKESKVIKFGIAGEYASIEPNTAFNRLNSYLNEYGRQESSGITTRAKEKDSVGKRDANLGVTLYAVYATKYARDVEYKNTAVFRVEKLLKAELKRNIEQVDRGKERTTVGLNKILSIINKYARVTDIPTKVKRSPRLSKK